MTTAHYYAVTWDQLHRDARALAWRLMPLGPFAGIVAVTRGGLIPAAIVARELECRLIETVCVLSYDEEQRGEPVVAKPPTAAADGAGWLVVDDLVDTGATARLVRSLLPRAHFAAVYAKPDGRPLAETFVTEVSQDTWILFPWDTAPQFVAPLVSGSPAARLSAASNSSSVASSRAAATANAASCPGPNSSRAPAGSGRPRQSRPRRNASTIASALADGSNATIACCAPQFQRSWVNKRRANASFSVDTTANAASRSSGQSHRRGQPSKGKRGAGT